MTMVMDHGNRQYGGMGYESVYQNHHVQSNPPQFSEGWSAQAASHPPASSVYAAPVGAGSSVALNQTPKREELPRPQQQQQPPPPAISVSYSNIPVSAPSMVPNGNYSSVPYGSSELLVLPQDIPRATLEQSQPTTTATAMNSFQPAATYSPLEYAHSLSHSQPPHHQPPPHPHPHSHPDARLHPTSQPPQPQGPAQPGTYGDALDASRGMVALSQDLTPRNIFAPRTARTSAEAYGFPPTHSSASSISSANNYPYYSASVVSVDSSVTDYSSATSESLDGLASRTLPRPSGLLGALPPNPQAMMGSFSSKTPANAQKKHKCKVCDKRFTRPSSLQTHMYSHTGEKPYACDFEGCGRHFSVVSNLRRHKKVHKPGKESGTPEEEE